MSQTHSSYAAAVSQRTAAYRALRSAQSTCRSKPWKCGAVAGKAATYSYWKGVASTRSVAYEAAKAVYEADIQSWIADNPALVSLRSALDAAAADAAAIRAEVDDLRGQLVSIADAVSVRGASFTGQLAILRDGAPFSMKLDLDVLGAPHTVTLDWAAGDFAGSVANLASRVLER